MGWFGGVIISPHFFILMESQKILKAFRSPLSPCCFALSQGTPSMTNQAPHLWSLTHYSLSQWEKDPPGFKNPNKQKALQLSQTQTKNPGMYQHMYSNNEL